MALAHLTLATQNVRKAEAFFTAALGWRPISRPNNIGRPAAWLEIAPGLVEVAGGATRAFLIGCASVMPPGAPTFRTNRKMGRNHPTPGVIGQDRGG
jgi:catechol 2,3-dioxygenase-like lactoylglutathione lyase family enzyme